MPALWWRRHIRSRLLEDADMNKAQLVEAVAKDSGLSKADSARALDSLVSTVTKTLKKGDDVAISGFGKWSVTKRGARAGRNPQTGEKVKIRASKAPKFTAGATLKAALNPRRARTSG
jgi:DNA-binding protein HU-beta